MLMSKPIFSNNDIMLRQLSCDTLLLAAGQPVLSSDRLGKRKDKKIQKTRPTLHERTMSSATPVCTWRWGTTATFDNSRLAGVFDVGREGSTMAQAIQRQQNQARESRPRKPHISAHRRRTHLHVSTTAPRRLLDIESFASIATRWRASPRRMRPPPSLQRLPQDAAFRYPTVPIPILDLPKFSPKATRHGSKGSACLKISTPRHGWPD